MKRFALVAVLLAVLVLFGWALTREPSVASPLVGKPAPTFSIPLFSDPDSVLSLEGLRGRPVVLNFWASWCLSCRDEARVLEAGWRAHGPEVAFVGVAINDEGDASRGFISEYGKTYLLGPDEDGSIAVDYGLFGVPETFFIDGEGRILSKHVGPLAEADLETRIAELRAGRVGGATGSADALTPLDSVGRQGP